MSDHDIEADYEPEDVPTSIKIRPEFLRGLLERSAAVASEPPATLARIGPTGPPEKPVAHARKMIRDGKGDGAILRETGLHPKAVKDIRRDEERKMRADERKARRERFGPKR